MKIRNLIGFEPKYDLEAMIQGVIDYFKEWTDHDRPGKDGHHGGTEDTEKRFCLSGDADN